MQRDHSPNLHRILRELGQDKIMTLLTKQISASDLNSLLLEVFREKMEQIEPKELLKKYEANRFVQPAEGDLLTLKQLELDVLRIAEEQSFAAIQLSPVAPLGSCSVVATVDQNKVISALRGTEVVADATNLLALHVAHLLKSDQADNSSTFLRFGTTHRHIRAQSLNNAPGMLPHFHVFCLVTSGKDNGSYSFEKQAFLEQASVYQSLFDRLFQTDIEIVLNARKGYADADGLVERVLQYSREQGIKAKLSVSDSVESNAYYQGLQFTIKTVINGNSYTIGDGGYVDWPNQLLGRRKERMLISAIGLDRLLPELARTSQ
ncbi:hypothetical protein [Paenibacillus sinopodophylli]|uniref:hypothetical protein n=1 Tax=Paenibacillus sinopodophylli TaxID=1837342 RepID=UPI00110CAF19|nr:hypothetical protein [Paenibacillus sinopodophylli]